MRTVQASNCNRRSHRQLIVVASLLLLCGCSTSQRGAGADRSAGEPSSPPTSARTLRIAFQGFEEPNGGVINYGSVGGFDPLEHFLVFHASLTVYTPQGTLVPRLAEKVPSLSDGDWQAFPDGTMTVTWKIRADATWHDGTPLTASDFVFGYKIVRDPDIPASRPPWASLVSSVEATDDRTLLVHWTQPSFLAGGTGASDIPALPAHILSDPYQAGDKQAFINHPYWTNDFVGLGPYKLGQWQRGSYIEGLAFDRFVGGRPQIDRILLMYVGDVNAIVAGVLSGDLDMVPMGARFDATQLMAVENGWGQEGGTTLLVPFGIRSIYLQFRDPSAPWARDVRVRRALVHATDRRGMSDALQYGLTKAADTFVLEEDPVFAQIDRGGLARYPYDLDRVRQLMADAGWIAGADGALRDGSGQPLAMEIAATGQGSNVEEIETVGNQWQQAGIQATPDALPPRAANLDERKNTVRGGFMWPWSPNAYAPQNLSAAQIASERTSWKGSNYSGYTTPAYEELYRRFTTSLEVDARQQVLADIMKYIAEEVPVIPVYYYGNGVIARKGLTGPAMITPMQTSSLWNVHTWSWNR